MYLYMCTTKFLRYRVRQTGIFVILDHFCPFNNPHPPPPNDPENLNFEKNEKNAWSYYPFIHKCVPWFLKYKVWQTEIFVILGIFYLSAPWHLGKSKFYNWKKNTWRYYHFTCLHSKWQSYDVWFLRYGAQLTEFFHILDLFYPFTTLCIQKVTILK